MPSKHISKSVAKTVTKYNEDEDEEAYHISDFVTMKRKKMHSLNPKWLQNRSHKIKIKMHSLNFEIYR